MTLAWIIKHTLLLPALVGGGSRRKKLFASLLLLDDGGGCHSVPGSWLAGWMAGYSVVFNLETVRVPLHPHLIHGHERWHSTSRQLWGERERGTQIDRQTDDGERANAGKTGPN